MGVWKNEKRYKFGCLLWQCKNTLVVRSCFVYVRVSFNVVNFMKNSPNVIILGVHGDMHAVVFTKIEN